MRILLPLLLAVLSGNVAYAQFSGGGAGPAPLKESAAALQQKCDAGNAIACANLGFRHLKGDGLPKDSKKAAALFERACDRGDAIGCTSLADLHETGEGVAKDRAKATGLFQRGCDGGDGDACVSLAIGYSAEKNEAKTALYADRACSAKNQLGCAILGAVLAEGVEGYPKDTQRADGLLFNACLKDAKFSEKPDAASRIACPALAKLRGKPSCMTLSVFNSPSGEVRNHCYDDKAGWVTTVTHATTKAQTKTDDSARQFPRQESSNAIVISGEKSPMLKKYENISLQEFASSGLSSRLIECNTLLQTLPDTDVLTVTGTWIKLHIMFDLLGMKGVSNENDRVAIVRDIDARVLTLFRAYSASSKSKSQDLQSSIFLRNNCSTIHAQFVDKSNKYLPKN